MSVKERFLNYVVIESTSSPSSTTLPSSEVQWDMARFLEKEMIEMGISNVRVNDGCVVYGSIPANVKAPTIGFIAHMDTSPDMNGKNVKPRIIKDYDGKKIILNEALNITMSPDEYPSLATNIHEDLIVTDGTTLLGADDKAGIAEILEMCEYILAHPEVPHGTIKIAFTPDEEVGQGTSSFEVDYFDADFAYTVDGGEVEHVDYENFNAASCVVTVHGKGIHPGSSKGKMINSLLVAMDFQHLLPVFDNPMYTEGYEGFNHLNNMSGNVDESKMVYILRNHDVSLLEKQKQDFINAAEFLNKKYGYEIISLDIHNSYSNMAEYIKEDMTCVNLAYEAIKKVGLTPTSTAIRGGTDGASLTYNGLKCPNLGTGGYNCHGKYEYASINKMEQMVSILIEIVKCAVK